MKEHKHLDQNQQRERMHKRRTGRPSGHRNQGGRGQYQTDRPSDYLSSSSARDEPAKRKSQINQTGAISVGRRGIIGAAGAEGVSQVIEIVREPSVLRI